MAEVGNGKAVAAAYKNLAALISDANVMPTWSPDGSAVGFVSGPKEQRQAWRANLATGEKTPLLDVAQLRKALLAATGITPAGQGVPFEHFAFIAPTMIAFAIGTDNISYDFVHGLAFMAPAPNAIDTYLGMNAQARMTPRPFKRSLPMIDPTDAYEIMSPDAQWLLSIQDRNVSLRATVDGRSFALTKDGTPEVEWTVDWTNPMFALLGLASPSTNWSPQATKIAAYRVDNRGVFQAPQMHYLKRQDEVVFRNFPTAGGVLEQHTLFILDVEGNAPVEIQLGNTRDQYPCFAGWLPDGSEVLVAVMSRDCRRIEVFAANAVTGAVRSLFVEERETFVRIHHDVYLGRKAGLTLTPDGKHFLWLSERDGWKHLYLYDLQGKLVSQLTSGDWAVCEVSSVIADHVYFTAHSDPQRPYDVHLCRVPLAGGAMQVLTQGEGKHGCMIAPNGQTFIDTYSTPSQPPITCLRRIDGTLLNAELLKADISKLQQVGYTAPEQFSVKAADGKTDLWGVMYKPFDFDPAKKYPVIEFIYGGPQMILGDHAFPAAGSLGGIPFRLAQLGYIAIALDARGTPDRSKAFHDTCYGSFKGTMSDDHAAAMRNLAAKHSFIDLSRVGITGHSWGAYSTIRCMLDQPDLYKAGIVTAPGIDVYSCVLYECYLGLPQLNPQGYRNADLYSQAAQLKGELMIAGGTSDHATWTDGIKMSEALIRAGKMHQFVPLPEQYHAFDSVHDEYVDRCIAAFFEQNLQSGKGENA
ncbi:MAG: DPP IV N-terminal domain-containing protein [Pseudomonadota bacterium]